MGEICIILLLALGGTSFVHIRLSKWRSKYRNPVLILNLIFPLIYLPVAMNIYWKLNDKGKTFITSSVLEYSFFAASAIALTIIHRNVYRKRSALPVRIARLIWPSLMIPLLDFLYLFALKAGVVNAFITCVYPCTPKDLNNYVQYYMYFFMIPLIISLIAFFGYTAFLIYVIVKVDHDFAKIREYWRKFVLKYFSSEGGDDRTG